VRSDLRGWCCVLLSVGTHVCRQQHRVRSRHWPRRGFGGRSTAIAFAATKLGMLPSPTRCANRPPASPQRYVFSSLSCARAACLTCVPDLRA
jgi:hypothetical protein